MNGIYYIQNQVSETRDAISGVFPSFDDAVNALKNCSDWYRENGTGKIYFLEFGLNKKPILKYEKH